MNPFHISRFCPAAMIGLVALGGFDAARVSAATINVSVDGQVIDQTGDDQGDAASVTGTISAGGGDAPTRKEYRTVLEFNISGATVDILAAQSISFAVEIRDFYVGAGTSSTTAAAYVPAFALYALTEDEDGAVGGNDYQALGTLVATFNPTDWEAGDILTADVTSYVKADVSALSPWSGFRLQVTDPAATPTPGTDPKWQLTRFVDGSAQLVTEVPEPASVALIVLSLGVFARRRG